MKNQMLNSTPLNADLGIFILRLTFGGLFIYHGYIKLSGYNEILPYFGDIIGIGSETSLILVVFAEFICGILVTIGLFTRLSVIPIFITMAVAFFIAHANDAFNKKELVLVFLLLSLAIFMFGSGKYSADRLLFKF